MNYFTTDIVKFARDNHDFRRVVYTATNSQVVVMSLHPGEELGMEVHQSIDQIFCFVEGKAQVTIDGVPLEVEKNDVVIVPAGTLHDVRNITAHPLRFFTIYSPPAHAPGTVHHTREDAEVDQHDYAPKRS